jgi:hypothetical protein
MPARRADAACAAIALQLLDHLPAPTPQAVRTARLAAGHSQAQAAALVQLGGATRWSKYERGHRSPDPARWAMYLLATDQHPAMHAPRRRGKAALEHEAPASAVEIRSRALVAQVIWPAHHPRPARARREVDR